jgi:hypothetical protein
MGRPGMRWPGACAAACALVACYPNPDQIRNQKEIPTPGTGGATGGAGGTGGARPEAAAGTGGVDAAIDTATDAAPSVRRCAEYAARFCARYTACSPPQAALAFGPESDCRERVQLECDLLELPGVTWPTQACADAFATHPCPDLLRNSDPPACRTQGALAMGAECASLFQCQTRRCAQAPGARCFACVPRSALGEPCGSSVACQDELVCNGKNVCVAPRALTAPCDADNPCLVPLLCRQGTCMPRGGEGAACTTSDDCDIVAGIGCNATTGRCVHYTVTSTCRTNPDGSFEICAARGTCNSMSSTCVPAAADGAPCSDTLGPHCRSPATCKAGTCKLPAPVSCPG